MDTGWIPDWIMDGLWTGYLDGNLHIPIPVDTVMDTGTGMDWDGY